MPFEPPGVIVEGAYAWAEEHFEGARIDLITDVARRVMSAGKLDLTHLAIIGAMKVVASKETGTEQEDPEFGITPAQRLAMVQNLPILGSQIGDTLPDLDRDQVAIDLETMFEGYSALKRRSAIEDLLFTSCLDFVRYERRDVLRGAINDLSNYTGAVLDGTSDAFDWAWVAEQRFVSPDFLHQVNGLLDEWIEQDPTHSKLNITKRVWQALARNYNTPVHEALDAAGKVTKPDPNILDPIFDRVATGRFEGRDLADLLRRICQPPANLLHRLRELDEGHSPPNYESRTIFKGKVLNTVASAVKYLRPIDQEAWKPFIAEQVAEFVDELPHSEKERLKRFKFRSADFLALVPLDDPVNCSAVLRTKNASEETRARAYEAHVSYGGTDSYLFKEQHRQGVSTVSLHGGWKAPLMPQERIAESAAVTRSGLQVARVLTSSPKFTDFPSAQDIPFVGQSRLFRLFDEALSAAPLRHVVQLGMPPNERALAELGRGWGNCLDRDSPYWDRVRRGVSLILTGTVDDHGESRSLIVEAALEAGDPRTGDRPKLDVMEIELDAGEKGSAELRRTVENALNDIFRPLADEFRPELVGGSRSRREPGDTAGTVVIDLTGSHVEKVAALIATIPDSAKSIGI